MEEEWKKLFFSSYFWHISLCFYSNSKWVAHWMRDLILHPTSTLIAYFWRTPLSQKQEIPEKHDDDVIITFFQVLLIFGVAGFVKSMECGYSLDAELNATSKELSHSEFSKTTGIHVENMNKKIVFFILPPKLITII